MLAKVEGGTSWRRTSTSTQRQFEYLVVETQGSITIAKLNELGREGWIFCSMYKDNALPTRSHLFYREVPSGLSEYTVAKAEIEGHVFTLEQDPDGLVWCYPDGSQTNVYLMGHDIMVAKARFARAAKSLLEQWKERSTAGTA